jgi:hypothetical protein
MVYHDPLGNPLNVYASLTEANINASIDGAGMGHDNPIDLISSDSGTVEEAFQPTGFSDDEEHEVLLAEEVLSESASEELEEVIAEWASDSSSSSEEISADVPPPHMPIYVRRRQRVQNILKRGY